MELRDYLRIVRKSWVVILVSTLAGVLFGGLLTIQETPTYRATAVVYVSFNTTADTGSGELVQGVTYAQRAISSYVDVAGTAIVVDRVSQQMGGNPTPAEVTKQVSASVPKDTSIINIDANSSHPEKAALLANTAASVLADVVENQLEKPADGPSRVQMEIINPATIPGSPISPKPARNLTLGFLLGAMLGLGLAVLRDVLDTRVRSRADVSAITEAPVLGEIPDDPDAKKDPLLKGDDKLSPRAEPFRTLRTNLQFLDVEGNPRSFTITSSLPEEGKTTVSANLAVTLAEAGAKVALIDADLRKPRLAEYMGLEGAVGLTDVLIGKATFSNALQKWGKQQLYVLPAGRIPPNPSELLGSKAMQEVLRSLEKHFDYVLVDAPPSLLVTDAAVVSRFTGGLLLVVAAGRTKKQELATVTEILHSAKANILGVILTMLPTKGPDAYRYANYGYQDYAAMRLTESSEPVPAAVEATAGSETRATFKPVRSKPLMEQ